MTTMGTDTAAIADGCIKEPSGPAAGIGGVAIETARTKASYERVERGTRRRNRHEKIARKKGLRDQTRSPHF